MIVLDEAHYPEVLEKMFVINAPIYFTAIWAMVRPWIDAVTVEKIQKIFGSNYGDALKTYVNLDQIPVEYGGTNETFPWTSPLNNVGYNEVVTPIEVIKEYATDIKLEEGVDSASLDATTATTPLSSDC